MKRCVVHFGLPKTGTSSIQHTFFNCPKELLPLEYVHLNMPNLTATLATIWHDNPEEFHRNVKLGLTSEEVAIKQNRLLTRLTRKVESIENTGLISAEGLSVLSEQSLRSFFTWLKRYSDDIVAVGYIRNPKSQMESSFQQKIKGNRMSTLDLDALYPSYRSRLEPFEKILGKERVHYRSFEQGIATHGDIVHDFCEYLGFKLDTQYIQRRNDSLSLEALKLLFAYRKHGPGYGRGPNVARENYRLINKLRELRGNKLRFSTSIITPILEKYTDDLRWMETRLGDSLRHTTPDDEVVISHEDELVVFDIESLRWLTNELGIPGVENSTITPTIVANLVHQLRTQLNTDATLTEKETQ